MPKAPALTTATAHLEAKLEAARREGRLPRGGDPLEAGLAAGLLEPAEAEALQEAARARRDAIEVDAFSPEIYFAPRKGQEQPALE